MTYICGPRPIYPVIGLNRPLDLSLTTEDIDGAKSRKRAFTTKRCTDPLDPHYKLPSYEICPVAIKPEPVGTIPTNYVADIDRCHPRLIHRPRAVSLDTLDVSDIPFAQPGYRRSQYRRISGRVPDQLSVQDINNGSSRALRARNTNPLDPVYILSTKDTWKGRESPSESIGPISESKPRLRVNNALPVHSQGSIEGSSPQRFVGCLPHSSLGKGDHPIRAPAIPTGSRSGSLRRGLVTKRETNPLDPNYFLLDGSVDSAYALFM